MKTIDMQIVIIDELQQLFDLRDHKNKLLEKLGEAEAEYRDNLQKNAGKDFVEVHDLEVTHKVLKPYNDIKAELLQTDIQLEQKKQIFIDLLEASGCPNLHCTNKEWHPDGKYEYVPYVLSIATNDEGDNDLFIEQKHVARTIEVR